MGDITKEEVEKSIKAMIEKHGQEKLDFALYSIILGYIYCNSILTDTTIKSIENQVSEEIDSINSIEEARSNYVKYN